MRAVVATSDHDYFLWQCVVQAYWMKQQGMEVTYLLYGQGSPSVHAKRLSSVADVEFWMDWRQPRERGYNPAMKPWLVGKWLKRRPSAVSKPTLLMDPDVIPTGVHEMPQPTATKWYGTDTDSYTGPGYLRSKGEDVWERLCGFVGVDPTTAQAWPGIGAQYVFTGQSSDFWEAVARTSVQAFKWMGRTAKGYTATLPDGTKDFPVQAWCSEMYIMQLEMIRRGIKPTLSPEMDMVWAAGDSADWGTKGFFHNAGVLQSNGRDFNKMAYQYSPWGKDIHVSPESASYRYLQLVKEVEEAWPKVVWR